MGTVGRQPPLRYLIFLVYENMSVDIDDRRCQADFCIFRLIPCIQSASPLMVIVLSSTSGLPVNCGQCEEDHI